ncbi:DUF3800 domain-containing protein [Treponema denticola]|nr:DUF3800 domain-containing protein [Treponema denticola]
MCVYSELESRVLPLSGASSFLAWLSFFVRRTFMYLLYADDSGVISDPKVKYSVLAGFATFENQTYWIQKAVDDIMLKYIGRADLELHASPIRSGKGIWRSFPKENRESILKECLDYVKNNYPRQFILFGAVIDNSTESVPENLFTQITSRFDKFLTRKYLKNKEPARGLAVFDKSKMENQYQNWSKIYQTMGNQWKEKLNNFSEVPLFLDSEMSRSIQIADLIAFSLFRNFEYNDNAYYSIIKDCFDKEKNLQHGLYLLGKNNI